MYEKKQKFLLGIGAPRSGTTWTYANLRVAGNIFMSPVKELRFFKGCRSTEEKAKEYQKFLLRADNDTADACFMERWSAAKDCDHSAYASMFPTLDYVGEFSPIYSIMSPVEIEKLKNCLSNFDVRVLYMLRNPLERDISHIYFAMHRQRKKATAYETDEYLRYINAKPFVRRSNYRLNRRNWRSQFGDRLKLMYYDHIERNPEDFINKLCLKLEIELDNSRISSQGRNGSSSFSHIRLPNDVIERLRKRHLSRVSKWKFLPERIKESWLEKIEQYDPDKVELA